MTLAAIANTVTSPKGGIRGYFESWAYDDTTKTYSNGEQVYVDCLGIGVRNDGPKSADKKAE